MQKVGFEFCSAVAFLHWVVDLQHPDNNENFAQQLADKFGVKNK